MADNGQITAADIESKAWISVNKNRFEPGEVVHAVLHYGHDTPPAGIYKADGFRFCLTDPIGNNTEIVPVKGTGDYCRLAFQLNAVGSYTLTGICKNTYTWDKKHRSFKGTQIERPNIGVINCLQICSVCFFVGDCEVAVPKAPSTRIMFVPEKWEIPNLYRLISVYLKKDGIPVPYAPVTMVFRNGDGYLKKELRADKYGNVYFVPYMAGSYCLINKSTLDEAIPGIYDSVSISTTFSFMISGKNKIGSKSKLKANFSSMILVE